MLATVVALYDTGLGDASPRFWGRRAEVFWRKLAVLVGALMALSLLAFAGIASAAPPEPVDTTPFTVPEGIACDFPLQAELSGKSNVKELPGGRTLSTSPGLRVTLTNLEEPTNQVSYVITGSFLIRELDDGNEFVVARGRNIVFGPNVGMFLTIGRFTFVAFDADGTPLALTQPEDNGRLIDVCAQLA
jgi:hypothetical protein